VVLVVPRHEILHDAATFEQSDGLAVRELVRQRWDSAIGVDVEEPLLLLSVLADVNLRVLIWESECPLVLRDGVVTPSRCLPELLERDGDLDTIRRLGCIEVDVGFGSHDEDLLN